jgi:hypothetical protein
MFTRKFTAVFFAVFSGSGGMQLSSFFRVHLFVLHFFRLFWVGVPIYALSSPFHLLSSIFLLIFSSIGFEIQERPIGIYGD